MRCACFEPHVTIHVGADRADAAKNALGAAAREYKLIGLTPLGIDQSDEFIKAFVQFAMSAELRQINDFIREAVNDSSQDELKPHLSLCIRIWQRQPERTGGLIDVAFSEVTFEITPYAPVRLRNPAQTLRRGALLQRLLCLAIASEETP